MSVVFFSIFQRSHSQFVEDKFFQMGRFGEGCLDISYFFLSEQRNTDDILSLNCSNNIESVTFLADIQNNSR